MPSNQLILCHPLLLPPSIFCSIRVFSNESALHIRWPKYWSFSFSINPSNEYSGLISYKIDWLISLLFKGLSRVSPAPQFKSTNPSMLSLGYGPAHSCTWLLEKKIPLTIQPVVGKVMALLFNTLTKFVIAFLPRSKLLISWLWSPSSVILEPKKIKSVTVSLFPFWFVMKW